jgi:hypothetical protein
MTNKFVGPSYHINARKADVQRAVNVFPVVNEVAGGKSVAYLDSIPGLVSFSAANAIADFYLLMEDGGALLQESTGFISLE